MTKALKDKIGRIAHVPRNSDVVHPSRWACL
jgi:hypothetical protein